MGSTFKALTLAMALDSGRFNAEVVVRRARAAAVRQVHHPRLSPAEPHAEPAGGVHLFVEHRHRAHGGGARRRAPQGSSCASSASSTGLRTELPESAEPIVPKRWMELNTVTIAFGHGLSVAPLQAMMAIGALVNGGNLIPPTFLKRSEEEAAKLAKRVIKPDTSEKMRYLMRLNVEKGTAEQGRRQGLLCRRQDRHRREGGDRPLFQDQAADHVHRGAAGRPAALRAADHARRAAGDAGDPRLRHLGLERGAGRRRGHRAGSRRLLGIEPRFELPPPTSRSWPAPGASFAAAVRGVSREPGIHAFLGIRRPSPSCRSVGMDAGLRPSAGPGMTNRHEARQPAHRRCRRRRARRRARGDRHQRRQPRDQAGRPVRGDRGHQGRRAALRRRGDRGRRRCDHGGARAAGAAAGRRRLRAGRPMRAARWRSARRKCSRASPT